jgi:hypothetical protein
VKYVTTNEVLIGDTRMSNRAFEEYSKAEFHFIYLKMIEGHSNEEIGALVQRTPDAIDFVRIGLRDLILTGDPSSNVGWAETTTTLFRQALVDLFNIKNDVDEL